MSSITKTGNAYTTGDGAAFASPVDAITHQLRSCLLDQGFSTIATAEICARPELVHEVMGEYFTALEEWPDVEDAPYPEDPA